jgi:hypothetical protein
LARYSSEFACIWVLWSPWSSHRRPAAPPLPCRRKEKAEPPLEYNHNQLYQNHSPGYAHASLGPGQHHKETVDPRGRWAIRAGQKQGERITGGILEF